MMAVMITIKHTAENTRQKNKLPLLKRTDYHYGAIRVQKGNAALKKCPFEAISNRIEKDDPIIPEASFVPLLSQIEIIAVRRAGPKYRLVTSRAGACPR